MLDKVSVFPVSIPPEDLPSKKTWHLAMMMAWVRELCGLQVLHCVNWLCFLSFYSNIYDEYINWLATLFFVARKWLLVVVRLVAKIATGNVLALVFIVFQ